MFLSKRSALVLAAALAGAVACDRSPTSSDMVAPADAPRLATNVSTVCRTQSVPYGYVILQYGRSISCPNYSATGFNNKTIGLPASPETACSDSQVPSGWVITSHGRSINCLNYSATSSNTFSLKSPSSPESVCSTSPIPSNYVVVSSGRSIDCLYYSATGYNTVTIQRI
jgi:hypothetical protein